MKVFTCTNFSGHWAVGSSAVIVAENVETARKLLEQRLVTIGLPQTIRFDQLEEVDLSTEAAIILQDGNY